MLLLVSGSTRSVRECAGRYPDRLGHLLTPSNRNSVASVVNTGLWWALDNGSFSGFDPVLFRRRLGVVRGEPRCLFVVAPDVVARARETIRLWMRWCADLAECGQPAAFVFQDGQEDLEIPEAEAYFIGGSTRWKLSSAAADCARYAKTRGAWLHMGRVNSRRRMAHAIELGCDSIDGSSASMFGDTYIPKYMKWLTHLETQRVLF